MIPRELHGRQPELRVLPIPTNVDVHGLSNHGVIGTVLPFVDRQRAPTS